MSEHSADESPELKAETAREALDLSKANGGAPVRLPSGSIVCVPSGLDVDLDDVKAEFAEMTERAKASPFWHHHRTNLVLSLTSMWDERDKLREDVARLTAERDELRRRVHRLINGEAIEGDDVCSHELNSQALREAVRELVGALDAGLLCVCCAATMGDEAGKHMSDCPLVAVEKAMSR